jgi:ribonuclease VapC
LTAYAIDTSVLIAILNVEEGAEGLKTFVDRNIRCCIGTATLHESFCVVRRHTIPNGPKRLETMVELIAPEIVSFDSSQLEIAKSAYSRFGRGTGHKASLNMGDCFSYALAKARRLPLLFKGDDFLHTDIEPALKAAAK